ncbi:MAG: short-chain dehydrogenase [Planctomycetaceae bacterium]|nr:short-chain dehydrogenase [Planctomycetaceae bacterium]|tara:strand:- start:7213 stop:8013 length:801 start_codon:yes stop_codon:yes gene_type:complete
MACVQDQVIIITGSTSGVGEACALEAAQNGAKGIVITGRDTERGEDVRNRVKALGTEAIFVPAELSDPDQCRNIVAQCDAKWGRVDGLVNSAADTNRGTIEETSVDFWDHQMNVNVRAPFILTQDCVKIMQREKIAGSIVNILSVAGFCGMDILCSYSTTKGALRTLTKNNANALRRHRIRVNGINLGWTDTPAEHIVQKVQGSPEDWLEQAESASPFGRLLKADDVGKLVTYLLSTESGILTGSCIDYSQRVMGVFPPEDAVGTW